MNVDAHIYVWVAEDSEEMKGIVNGRIQKLLQDCWTYSPKKNFFHGYQQQCQQVIKNHLLKAMPTGPGFWHFPTLNISAHWNGIVVGFFSRHKNSFWALNVSDSTITLFSLLIALPGLRSLASGWVGYFTVYARNCGEGFKIGSVPFPPRVYHPTESEKEKIGNC